MELELIGRVPIRKYDYGIYPFLLKEGE